MSSILNGEYRIQARNEREFSELEKAYKALIVRYTFRGEGKLIVAQENLDGPTVTISAPDGKIGSISTNGGGNNASFERVTHGHVRIRLEDRVYCISL